MNCTWCQTNIIHDLSFQEILFPFTQKKHQRCEDCDKRLEKVAEKQGCQRCGKSVSTQICADCLFWQKKYPDYYFRHFALYHYNQGFQEWIHHYKFLGDLRLKHTFAEEIQSFFKKNQADFIIPIPLSSARFSDRGFNQTAEFLDAAKVKFTPLIERKLHLKAQSEQSREERLAMQQPFTVLPEATKVANKTVIIVDDVYTTGRTLFYAAELLLAYQPKQLFTFSIAR